MSAKNVFAPSTIVLSAKVNENFAMCLASGIIQQFGGDVAPSGWLLCDGSVVSQATYADLYAVVGTKFNTSGEGAGNFRLPDFRGRVAVGKDGTTEFNVVGTSGGAKTHTLQITEIPSHYHTVDPPNTNTGYVSSDHTHYTSSRVLASNTTGYAVTDAPPHGDSRYWNFNSPGRSSGIINNHYHAVDIASFNSGNTGGGGAHNNLQPYLTINYIIKS